MVKKDEGLGVKNGKKFRLLDRHGKVTSHVFTGTPRSSALKAAMRKKDEFPTGEEFDIYLKEMNTHQGPPTRSGAVHVFKGQYRAMTPEEETPFTQKNNIKFKSTVRKVGIYSLECEKEQ